jgi:hypothetical protein
MKQDSSPKGANYLSQRSQPLAKKKRHCFGGIVAFFCNNADKISTQVKELTLPFYQYLRIRVQGLK